MEPVTAVVDEQDEKTPETIIAQIKVEGRTKRCYRGLKNYSLNAKPETHSAAVMMIGPLYELRETAKDSDNLGRENR